MMNSNVHGGAKVAIHQDDKQHQGRDQGMSMMLMMALMMGLCMGIFLLFALIPVVGWPAGIAIALAGGAAMLAAHQWLMGRMRH